MFRCVSVTLDSTYESYIPATRILNPSSSCNSSWVMHTTLPYNINPGDRIKIRSRETRGCNITCGNYIIQEDPSIGDLGVDLTYTTDMDTDGRYYFMMHNYGTSTVTLTYGMALGKVMVFSYHDA